MVNKGVLMLHFDTGSKVQVVDLAYHNRFCLDLESFSNQTESIYCIECIDNCIVESISYKDLINVFNYSQNIERAYRLVLERVLSSVIKRNISLSTQTIQERFFSLMATRPELFSLASHKHIASYLNIDATNFSKLYNGCKGKLWFS